MHKANPGEQCAKGILTHHVKGISMSPLPSSISTAKFGLKYGL